MKRLLPILVLFNLLSFTDAQWFPLNSGTTNNLNGLCVVGPLNVFIVGDGGIILKTLDGGLTWSQQTPVPYTLRSISFCDQYTGIAVGDNGVILKTTDGGNVWFPLNSGVTNKLKNVWYYSLSNATILQYGNKYMITSDGGNSWNTISTYGYPWDFSYSDMAYTNWGPRRGAFTGQGYMVEPPGGPFIRVVFTSADGSNWNHDFEQTMNSFTQVSVLPEGRLFVVSLSGEIYTKNTGSWEMRGFLDGSNLVKDLFFVNENSGTALKSNGIFRTSDGGWNWEMISPLNLKSVAFADSNIGYAVGGGGAIAKTINGGRLVNYFPDGLTNKYQIYQSGYADHHGGGPIYWTDYKNYRVLSDSIIEGKRFINFSQNAYFGSNIYYYYDGNQQKLYTKIPGDDTIRIAVDFNSPDGDSVLSYITGTPLMFRSYGCSDQVIFGDTVSTYKMTFWNFFSYWSLSYRYTFYENLGLGVFERGVYDFYLGSDHIKDSVISAVIDTTVYNRIVLQITNISPLINRPVNTFPFILTGDYYTNLNLIDTFYTKITLIRGEDTFFIPSSYPFVNKNASIQIYPHVGDRLLLKAFISDKSIFENYDTFPDSGYAEILVLPALTDVQDQNKPLLFNLDQNYPNPFNPASTIRYSIPERSLVTLTIYDVMGKQIIRAVNEEKTAGIYTYEFDGSGLSSSVYFYKLQAGLKTEIRKMILLK